MLKSLFGRNFTLLVVLVLAAQLIAGLAVSAFIIRPQLSRATSIVADMVENLSITLDAVPADKRPAVIASYANQQAVVILPEGTEPSGENLRPRMLERAYLRMLTHSIEGQGAIPWRMDSNKRLWLRLKLGGDYYWMALESPRLWTPITTLSLVMLITLIAAATAGFLVQRRLSAPLDRVAKAADRFDPQTPMELLPEDGPSEVARLSSSFNRMGRRLSSIEREREIMLAGISHDLRTPLAKLRLSLAMMKGEDGELLEGCDRQVEMIDTMLGQFFDYARGFENEPITNAPLSPILTDAVARADGTGQVTISCDDAMALPVRVEALTRGIANLVRNALVHGAAPVSVAAVEGEHSAEIRVIDSGPGFSEAQAEKFISPFARGNAARSSAGSGLGLAIAQRAALANGGNVRFARGEDGFTAILTVGPA